MEEEDTLFFTLGEELFPKSPIMVRPVTPVWKTWQIFHNLKFRHMPKKINKLNFSFVYSVSMGEMASISIEIK